MTKQTGFICHESYFWHDTGNGALFLRPGGWVETDVHSENPATKRRVVNLLERSEFIKELKMIEPREATRAEVEAVHSGSYIEKVKKLSDGLGGDAGVAAIVGVGSYEIALLSAGGAIAGVDAVMSGEVKNAYVLTRPPGHHAVKEMGMGFCLFNNVAIATHYARKKYHLKRVMIIDWDVHHGNGTEDAFYDEDEVLFVSLHQELNFPPNSGLVDHVGEGKGKGFNVNVPLPAGTGDAGYLYAFEKVIEPLTDQFQPELIMVSAGQDPNVYDPLAHMMVTAEGFGKMANLVKKLADKHCEGRLVACHEGGYSAAYVPFCTLRVIEAMSGQKSKVEEDPFQLGLESLPTDVLFDHQKEAVENVINIQKEYWNF